MFSKTIESRAYKKAPRTMPFKRLTASQFFRSTALHAASCFSTPINSVARSVSSTVILHYQPELAVQHRLRQNVGSVDHVAPSRSKHPPGSPPAQQANRRAI